MILGYEIETPIEVVLPKPRGRLLTIFFVVSYLLILCKILCNM